MKKTITLALTCALLLILAVTQTSIPVAIAETIAGSYQTIAPEEVWTLLNEGISLTLVDVRRADEYAEAHIPGALNIANEDIGTERLEALPELDAPIVVYCRSGRRSQEAANKLLKLGYTNVSDLGGIQSWPYDTVSGSEPGVWTIAPNSLLSHFHTTDLDGNPVDHSVLTESKLTMVNVWATYCGPCLSEMPDLGELAAEYQEKGVQIMGIVSDVLTYDGNLDAEQIKTAQDVVSATHADYLHIVPSDDLFSLLYQITSVPTTFFVDQNGNQVGYAYLGSQSKEQWSAIIDETLALVEADQ